MQLNVLYVVLISSNHFQVVECKNKQANKGRKEGIETCDVKSFLEENVYCTLDKRALYSESPVHKDTQINF